MHRDLTRDAPRLIAVKIGELWSVASGKPKLHNRDFRESAVYYWYIRYLYLMHALTLEFTYRSTVPPLLIHAWFIYVYLLNKWFLISDFYIIFRTRVPFQKKHRMQIRKPCRVWETHVSNVCLHYVPLHRGYGDTEGHYLTSSGKRGSEVFAISNQEHLSNSIPVQSESIQITRFMGPPWAHLRPTGPRWAPCWPHELCYLGYMVIPPTSIQII